MRASAHRRLLSRGPLTTVVIAVAVLTAVAGTPAAAQPQAPQQRFDAATELMVAGEYQRAAQQLVALADDAPDSPLADDALFTAGKLYQEHLAQPARALVLYQRLIRDYPGSRTALAAQRRAAALAHTVGPGGAGEQPAALFADILQHFTTRGERESLARAQSVLDAHPEWPGRARVLAWTGDVHHRAGRHEQALARYLAAAEAAEAAAAAGSDELLLESYRGAGEAALALDRFDAAEAFFRAMPVAGDPSRIRSLEDALARVDRQRLRAQLYLLAFLILIAAAAVLLALWRSAVESWSDLWRAAHIIPPEVVFMAPIAALLMVASLTAHYAIAPAVAIICIGGLAITWLSGVALLSARAHPAGLGRWRPAVHAVASALAVLALTYIALHRNRLIDMIIETVRFGPDVS